MNCIKKNLVHFVSSRWVVKNMYTMETSVFKIKQHDLNTLLWPTEPRELKPLTIYQVYVCCSTNSVELSGTLWQPIYLKYLHTSPNQQHSSHDDSEHIVSHHADRCVETVPMLFTENVERRKAATTRMYISRGPMLWRWSDEFFFTSDTRNNTNENDIKTNFSSKVTSVV